jgi:protein-S-isoprenylcysteine O-methyltransferase Ste14
VVPLVSGLVLNGRVRLPLIAAQCGTRPGVAALVRGVALNGWFLKTMRDGNGPKLTTTGPFRYTRNPRYLALTPILGNRVQTRSGEEGGEDRFDREPRKLM